VYGVTESTGEAKYSISIPREASHNILKNKSKKHSMECTGSTEYKRIENSKTCRKRTIYS
jgi:hypothetical protein